MGGERIEADRGDGVANDDSNLRSTAGAYAELVRLPNLFTAPPDVVLGAALAAVVGHDVAPGMVGGLAIVSMTLYAGGTALNDAFDAPRDAVDRPDRPIPSGRVDRQTGFGLGFGFLLIGVGAAFAVGGGGSALVAGALAAVIVLYDGFLSGSPVGAVAMGTTRGLNVVLGATAAAVALPELPTWTLAVPAVVTAYIAAVTHMAARETAGENRGAVALAGAGALLALLALVGYYAALTPGPLATAIAAVFAAAFAWRVGRPLRAAYAAPVPETVGPAVGACVLGLALLDAAFAAAAGLEWALAAAAFLVPAWLLSRAFDVT